jgi:hypothetical protein
MSLTGKIVGVVGAVFNLTRSGNTITISAPAGGSVVITGQSFTTLSVAGGSFIVDGSGNLIVGGTALVTGAVTCQQGVALSSGNLSVQGGNASVNGSLSVGGGHFTVDASGNVSTSANASLSSLTGPGNILPLMDSLGNAAALQLLERGSDPTAPAGNNAILYLRDNGSGKSQLCIQFPTGSPIAIATEA